MGHARRRLCRNAIHRSLTASQQVLQPLDLQGMTSTPSTLNVCIGPERQHGLRSETPLVESSAPYATFGAMSRRASLLVSKQLLINTVSSAT